MWEGEKKEDPKGKMGNRRKPTLSKKPPKSFDAKEVERDAEGEEQNRQVKT